MFAFQLSNDFKEVLESVFHATLSIYKILMGTLLAVWVPQSCPENNGGTCEIDQQFTDLTPYNVLALVFNFVALAFVIIFRSLLLLRERFLISHFDQDASKPDNFFQEVLAIYPTVQRGLHVQNMRCYWMNAIAIAVVILNVVLSLALVVVYWDSYRTGTVFTTYVILIGELIWSSFTVLRNPALSTCSAMRSAPVLHNVLDVDLFPKISDPMSVVSATAVEVKCL
eukprot:ANDGO_00346.mRNA.1 hypothetical protein